MQNKMLISEIEFPAKTITVQQENSKSGLDIDRMPIFFIFENYDKKYNFDNEKN
jgi:hypothetical protein